MANLGLTYTVVITAMLSPATLFGEEDPSTGVDSSRRHSFSVEFRSRSEAGSGVGFDSRHHHLDTLSRLRVSAEVHPLSWMRLNLQFQDSRTAAGEDPDIRGSMSNPMDFRDAYLELERPENRSWNLRLGRQPLDLGDQRLIGSDGEWCNRGRRFDGARVTFRRAEWQWDLFSGSVSAVTPDRFDPPQSHDHLSGLYATWARPSWHSTVEPYALWTRTRKSTEPDAAPDKVHLWTTGVRIAVDLPANSRLASEMAWQAGRAGGRTARAWAGSWLAGHRLAERENAPEIALGYSVAGGNRKGAEGPRGTFDDLYPDGFNGNGFLDPFAWRNLRDLSAAFEWKPVRHWRLASELHGYWLATIQDGVYIDGGVCIHLNPHAASSHLGEQFNIVAQYRRPAHWELAFGYARLFAGPYLREASLGVSANSAFLAWTLRL